MAEPRSTSPEGRYQVLVTPWEARNSLWVDTPELRDIDSGAALLRFASSHWSLDQATWTSDAVVELLLRKYPGNHRPPQLHLTVDCQGGTAAVEGGPPLPLGAVEAALEASLSWP